jgi:hypothetical protein
MRIGYSPYTHSLTASGDRRRFCAYADARRLGFELADPSRAYDLVVVSNGGDLVSWSNGRSRAKKVVFDLCNAYLSTPFGPMDTARGLGKYVLGDLGHPVPSYRRAVERLCRRADAVVCTTREQALAIKPFCPNVHVILDISQSSVTEIKTDYRSGDVLNLFWEGLPYNLRHFDLLRDVLRELSTSQPVAVHIMTLLQFGRWSRRVGTVYTKSVTSRLFERSYVYEWNELMLSRLAAGSDLGVIPLDLRDPLAAGKPENKLLWMWRVGLPTLVSATPAYSRAMEAAGLDMTCATRGQWAQKLAEFGGSEERRREAGERGRAYVESHHDSRPMLAAWDRVLQSVGVG